MNGKKLYIFHIMAGGRKGKVEGRTISLVGGEFGLDPVDVYLGIPYALPPIGIWR